jgi:integrase
LSPQTILHHHRILSEALKQAVQLQLLIRNPADAVKPPRVPDRVVKVLNHAEIQWLLELAEGTRCYVPIMLAVCAGLRRGEILALRWSDLDWDNAVLRVERAVEETKTSVGMKPPKSKRGRRRVTLPSIAIEALKQHRSYQDEYRAKLGPDYEDNGLICCVEDGRLWTPSAFTSAYRDLLRRRKLTGPNFHALRHAHASHLISQGTDVATVSARLGHSRTGFTLDTYVHQLPGQDEQAAQRLDVALRAARDQIHQNRA